MNAVNKKHNEKDNEMAQLTKIILKQTARHTCDISLYTKNMFFLLPLSIFVLNTTWKYWLGGRQKAAKRKAISGYTSLYYLLWSCNQLEKSSYLSSWCGRQNQTRQTTSCPLFWKHLPPIKQRNDAVSKLRFPVNSSVLRNDHLSLVSMIVRIAPVVSKFFETIRTTGAIGSFHVIVAIASNARDALLLRCRQRCLWVRQ